MICGRASEVIVRLRKQSSFLTYRWRTRIRYLRMVPAVFRNWWVWVLPKLGVSTILELRDGTRFLVRSKTTDLSTVNEAVILNPYLGNGYVDLPQNSIVIDVGANIGDFAVQVARLRPGGQVYAIEPMAENARMIAINKILNSLSNLQILQLAPGSHEGKVELQLNGNASSICWGRSDAKSETVRLTTLSQLIQELGIEHIDLLKLDCEGAEWDILPGCGDLFANIKQICMEFHLAEGWTVERLVCLLRKAGYDVRHTGGEWNGLLWATRRSSATDGMAIDPKLQMHLVSRQDDEPRREILSRLP